MKFDWEHLEILPDSKVARAFSPTNIALAKYWGKRDLSLNLPQNSSLSVTLDDLGSFTTVEFNREFTEDSIFLDGKIKIDGSFIKKARLVLNLLRSRSSSAGGSQNDVVLPVFARIQTRNNFPTGAGLASSASGLSALALAGCSALGLDISKEELSAISRQGSGSACRSFFGGFVQWNRGETPDGSDSIAESIAGVGHWPLGVFVAIVEEKEKMNPSTDAMELTRMSSPYFSSWVEFAEKNVKAIREAVMEKDFSKLAVLSEENCLKMHASAQASSPPLLFWEAQTVALMKKVWDMRNRGFKVFFTIDAGPNVVIFCNDIRVGEIKNELLSISGIRVLESSIGDGAKVLDA